LATGVTAPSSGVQGASKVGGGGRRRKNLEKD